MENLNAYLTETLCGEGLLEIHVPDFGAVVRFQPHRFNETQEVVFMDEGEVIARLGVMGVARLMRLVGAWAMENCSDKCF